MKKGFCSIAIVTVLLLSLSVTTAFAGVNEFPELMDWFKDKDYGKIDEFIYDDQTGIIESTAACDITVHDSEPLWEASPYMLSNCSGVVFPFDDVLFNGSVGDELSEEYLEFASSMASYPLMRLGYGNNANMLEMVGPQEKRSVGKCVLSEEDQEIYMAVEPRHRTPNGETLAKTGPLEMIKAAEAMNPDVRFTLIMSFVYATPEDNANFVRFLMDDPSESVWGQMRAEYGHPEPVKLHSIEIGNEVYIRNSYGEEEDKRQVEFYARMFKAHADAIAQYHPEVGCSICLMCMDGEAHEVWNVPMIKELGPYIMEKYDENNRFVSLHHYYSGYEMAYTQNRIQVCIDSLNEILGEGHGIRGLFSEHSKWASDWIAPTTLESGLATCQFLNRMYQWDYFTSYAAHYFCWHSHNLWNSFRRSPRDDTLVRSGPDYMYNIYLDNLGDRVFRSDVVTLDDSEIGDINSTRQLYSVCAMGNGTNELKLIMANRAPNTDIALKFSFDSGNSYTLIGEETLTAPNIYSFPYSADTQEIFTKTKTEKNEPGFTEYRMPPKSMVVLTLKSNRAIASLDGESGADSGDAVYDGERQFDDVENHWAKNEINLLAAEGILSGKSDNLFCPKDRITRAEFAVIMSRALKLEDFSGEMAFSDVEHDSWYEKSVNAVAASGYMRGDGNGSFSPNDGITLGEAAAAVSRALRSDTSEYDVDSSSELLNNVDFEGELTEWERECFAVLIHNGLFSKFYEEKTVLKDKEISRAEAAVLLYRLKNKKGV